MKCDLHVTTTGHPHVVVDADGLEVLELDADLADALVGVPIYVGPCTCPGGFPPGAPVTLLGFLLR